MLKHHLLIYLAGGTLVSAPAFGQGDPADAEDIDTIFVTASRSPLSRVDAGSATTVITRDDIELRQARYVTELLRSVPGFAVSQVGTSGSQTQVRVRGAEANHVLVMIDGIRANDPASGDEFRWELLSTSNIERIEIVRGPQSSLWGSDAVAAVVHVITQGGSGEPRVNVYAEGGSHDTVNGGLNGRFGGDRYSFGFGVERLDTEGTNVSRSGTEADGSELTTASLSSTFSPTAGLDLMLGLRAVDAMSQFDPVDFFATGLPVDGDVASDAERIYGNAGLRLRTLDGRIVHRLDFRYLDTDNTNLADGQVESSTASDRKTLAYQSDIRIGSNLLSLAIEHERTRFHQRGEIVFGDPNQDQEMNVTSIMGDFQGNATDHLTWQLSARFDDNSDFDSAVSGRLSVAYAASDSTVLRANIGTGRKAPTFIERFGFFPAQFVGNPDLKPEESASVDAGIDQALFDDTLNLQLTLFYQDLENEIDGFVFDPDTFLFTAENIVGDSTRKGAEASADFSVTEDLHVGGTYTYTDSKHSDPSGSDVRELRRPRHSGSLYANYRFLDERANLRVVAEYGGTSTDEFFPPFPLPSQTVTLDSYWLVGVTVRYEASSRASLYVRATNLFDEEYEQVVGYRTPGRSAYVGVEIGFGN